jgi:7-cyano-7-deazaguanine synthase
LERSKALILLSGGLDSATAAAVAVSEGKECTALTFAYGQRHRIEVSFARKLAAFFDLGRHLVVEIPAHLFSTSALSAESALEVPRNRDVAGAAGIPSTYVPARNILFLSYALAVAESSGISDIYIGVNSVDYSGYPDCRPEFIAAFEKMANLGTRSGVQGRPFRIIAPLMLMKKSEIISLGTRLGVNYSLTHSCYDPAEAGDSCGECDSCLLRKRGFIQAGITDPTVYRIS